MSEPGGPLELIESSEASLLDTVDHLLNKGLVLTGEVVIGLAGIDLIYLRLTALLCAADRILPKVSEEGPEE
ncbi:MAG: gas vesicle protein [Thermoanaerobaculia bacterium]